MCAPAHAQAPGLRDDYSNPLTGWKNHPVREKTKSEPSEAGPILEGRRRLRIWSFRGTYGNRGNGMEQASSDVGTHERIRTSDPSLRRRVLYPAELRGLVLSCKLVLSYEIIQQNGTVVNCRFV